MKTYEWMFENVIRQPVELATLAKKTLRVVLETADLVNISLLMSALAAELTGLVSTHHLGRSLTEGEIIEACLLSRKGFLVC